MTQPFSFDLSPGALIFCQAKLTWVGPQTKRVPSLLWSTYHRLPRLEAFARLRTAGLGYANDDEALWHFAVEPEEAAGMLERLRTALADARPAEAPVLSLMVVPGRPGAEDTGSFELLLDLEDGRAAVRAGGEGLDPGNGLARKVLGLFGQAVGA